jgi:hypothetical protein
MLPDATPRIRLQSVNEGDIEAEDVDETGSDFFNMRKSSCEETPKTVRESKIGVGANHSELFSPNLNSSIEGRIGTNRSFLKLKSDMTSLKGYYRALQASIEMNKK